MKNRVIYSAIMLGLMATAFGQSKQAENPELIDPSLNLTENQYMNNQAEALLQQASEILINHLPEWPEPPARRSALLLMDGVLHDVYAPLRPPVQEFFKTRISRAIDEIEQSDIKDGAHIWNV